MQKENRAWRGFLFSGLYLVDLWSVALCKIVHTQNFSKPPSFFDILCLQVLRNRLLGFIRGIVRYRVARMPRIVSVPNHTRLSKKLYAFTGSNAGCFLY